ncbi:hypothetical protein JTE90_021849 [Oedothorax gibbosus]|uniref:Uncharacterized protein n=1 Tax=Oedothorax gibbosus TaxID=931172 RepID=A0AAV6UYQ2_9ARAC|nr:hypothetical protein JTE90_021849 [Oedothorax gibbosus]
MCNLQLAEDLQTAPLLPPLPPVEIFIMLREQEGGGYRKPQNQDVERVGRWHKRDACSGVVLQVRLDSKAKEAVGHSLVLFLQSVETAGKDSKEAMCVGVFRTIKSPTTQKMLFGGVWNDFFGLYPSSAFFWGLLCPMEFRRFLFGSSTQIPAGKMGFCGEVVAVGFV